MNQVRKLQYIGNQFLLNVPADLVRHFNLQKGDYLEYTPGGDNNFIVRKVAQNTMPRAEAILQNMRNEAYMLSIFLNGMASTMTPEQFSGRQAQLTNLQARIRKAENKLRPQ